MPYAEADLCCCLSKQAVATGNKDTYPPRKSEFALFIATQLPVAPPTSSCVPPGLRTRTKVLPCVASSRVIGVNSREPMTCGFVFRFPRL